MPVICNNATAMSDFSFFGNNLIDFSDKNILDRIIMNCLNDRDSDRLNLISKEIKQKYNWHSIAEEFNKSLNAFR